MRMALRSILWSVMCAHGLCVITGTAWLVGGESRTPEASIRNQGATALNRSPVRIKDVADILGVRDNQLLGQGLVVGLNGTGDKTGDHAAQLLQNFTTRMGLNIPAALLKPKNIAVVAVTATLPPFARKGAKLDVQVSSLGDATSLQGGILLQTPLVGGDGRVYVVAQGALSIGGFAADGGGGAGGSAIQKNHPLVGRAPNGGMVEREVETCFQRGGLVSLVLRAGDFTTARRMAECINQRWRDSASALDSNSISFMIPSTGSASPVEIVAELENLRFTPDQRAKVVINERTGTVVAGLDVRIAPTVLTHGGLLIAVKRVPVIAQPEAFSNGATTVVADSATTATEEDSQALVFGPGPTLGDLAAALNALKVKPRDVIAIFQALKEAGALNAELVIM